MFWLPVYAAGDGVVVEVHDGEPDNRRVDPYDLMTRPKAYGGNYIIIKHGSDEYTWYSHLMYHSIDVKAGDRVTDKNRIASIGASGSALFPHLHFELRKGRSDGSIEGVPIYFSDYESTGIKSEKVKANGFLSPGELIKNK